MLWSGGIWPRLPWAKKNRRICMSGRGMVMPDSRLGTARGAGIISAGSWNPTAQLCSPDCSQEESKLHLLEDASISLHKLRGEAPIYLKNKKNITFIGIYLMLIRGTCTRTSQLPPPHLQEALGSREPQSRLCDKHCVTHWCSPAPFPFNIVTRWWYTTFACLTNASSVHRVCLSMIRKQDAFPAQTNHKWSTGGKVEAVCYSLVGDAREEITALTRGMRKHWDSQQRGSRLQAD